MKTYLQYLEDHQRKLDARGKFLRIIGYGAVAGVMVGVVGAGVQLCM